MSKRVEDTRSHSINEEDENNGLCEGAQHLLKDEDKLKNTEEYEANDEEEEDDDETSFSP